MISRILLLIIIIIINSCLCAATFVVNVAQSSYQAEENQNVTLEWTFTTRPHGSSESLLIICDFRTSSNRGLLYVHQDGDDVSERQDEQFSGRVQNDKDVLREGRIRLHVSRLRTEDSGLYLCDVKVDEDYDSAECRLNVFAADQLQTQRPTLTPQPERRGRTLFFIPLGLAAAALIVLIMLIIWFRKRQKKNNLNKGFRGIHFLQLLCETQGPPWTGDLSITGQHSRYNHPVASQRGSKLAGEYH